MNENIYRQKSLERFKTPEELNDYIKVANPGIWLLLVGVIVLLAGICIWSIFGRVDSTAPADIHIEDGVVICFINEEDEREVKEGMTVVFEEYEGILVETGDADAHGKMYSVQMEEVPDDGFYAGKIVLKSYRPISFVMN